MPANIRRRLVGMKNQSREARAGGVPAGCSGYSSEPTATPLSRGAGGRGSAQFALKIINLRQPVILQLDGASGSPSCSLFTSTSTAS